LGQHREGRVQLLDKGLNINAEPGRLFPGRKERTMNKYRRKSLQDIIEHLEELKGSLEGLQAEEEECRDNMPENLQGSEKYERADEAVDQLGDAISSLEDAISSVEAATE